MTTPAPHFLLEQDAQIQSLIQKSQSPWRKKSKIQGDFGLEQIFEHPESRTWVKILENPWETKIIGIARRQQDLPTSQQFIQEAIQKQRSGSLPQYSSKLVDHLEPALEHDLKKQALAKKWVKNWAKSEYSPELKYVRPIKALLKEIPLAVANQFKFGIIIEEIGQSLNLSIGQHLQGLQMSVMNNMGGNNFLKTQARLVLQFNQKANSYHHELDNPFIAQILQTIFPRFPHYEPGCADEGNAYLLFEKALQIGLIWDESLQNQLDEHLREHFGHLTPGGERIESTLERAKLRKMLDTQIPAAPKKRL